MLVSQGIDIVSVKRIAKLYEKYDDRFVKRIFSVSELKELNFTSHKKKDFLLKFSNRFAAKEAASKALGTGISNGVRFKDIEIFSNELGKPFIRFKGNAKKIFKKFNKDKKRVKANISMSNERKFAIAIVSISVE